MRRSCGDMNEIVWSNYLHETTCKLNNGEYAVALRAIYDRISLNYRPA